MLSQVNICLTYNNNNKNNNNKNNNNSNNNDNNNNIVNFIILEILAMWDVLWSNVFYVYYGFIIINIC